MQRWEYCHIDTFRTPKVARFIDATGVREETFAAGIEGTLAYMAALGADGWELTGIEVRVETRETDSQVPADPPVRSQPVY
jgi:hypothetical protein